MPRTVLVAPTGQGVGLTSTALGLVEALDRAGVAVGFVKPLAQVAVEHSAALVRLISRVDPPPALPAALVEELLGAGRLDDLMDEVAALVDTVKGCDVVVVEGLVPARDRVWSTRVDTAMARALDADVLLVADGAGAAPDHLADAVALAAAPYRSGERQRVVGCVVNRTSDGAAPGFATELRRHHIRLVAAVPFRAELTRPRVADVARALDARAVVAGDTARRVSEVVVCAQAVRGLLPLLRDGALLLVPGDRDDVVLAAGLAALRGVRLAGLLLTAGVEPDPGVLALAGARGLPILVCDELTYPAAVRVHELSATLSLDDPTRACAAAATVADALDEPWVRALPEPGRRVRLTPAAFRHRLLETARRADRLIVLPEGTEPRILAAAIACAEQGIARTVLLADPVGMRELPRSVTVVDPASVAERHVDRLVALRAHHGMTPGKARDLLTDPITVAMMMLAAGEVDGLVAGAVHPTAATVRPALQLIGVAKGARLVSSIFFMCLPDEVVVYGDCAVNPDPSAEDLADIALQSAASAATAGITPRIAMISFSTGSSGAGADVDKVAEATRIVRERAPDLPVDGPLQYDAASVTSVASNKRPGSEVAGRATVFVFPDLNTGNTTYKAVQRSADVMSIGPILQGLAKPVNDLSRGATVEDIVYTLAVTACQSMVDGSGR